MSTKDRLDKGFVNWQGQRIFLPWFGAPRVVPSAEDEVRVVKIRFRLHVAMAVMVVPFFAVGVWLGDPEGYAGVAVGISVVFGSGALFDRHRVRHWPMLMTSRFAPARFLLGYFRDLPIMARVDALGWSGLALILCLLVFLMIVVKLMEHADDSWLLVKLALALLGPGALSFLAFRHAAIAAVSLIPPFRRLWSTAAPHCSSGDE